MTTIADVAMRRRSRSARLRLVLGAIAWIAIVCGVARAGWTLRAWTWRATAPIRFRGDVGNALHLGREVNRDAIARLSPERRTPTTVPAWPDVWAAYHATYDRAFDSGTAAMAREHSTAELRYPLDYPPGRLAVATVWVHHLRAEFAAGRGADPREYDDALVPPMLRLNAIHEAIAALGAFALARRSLRHAGRSRARATWLATLAASLVWLSPAAILDAHGWPQWDVWVLPYTIWAAYLALRGRWMGVGAMLAVGAMFKGQVLIVAPLFVVWPLARGEVGAAVRVAAGFLAAAALCVAPWLIQTVEATRWMIGVAIALSVLLALARVTDRAIDSAGAFSRSRVAASLLAIRAGCANKFAATRRKTNVQRRDETQCGTVSNHRSVNRSRLAIHATLALFASAWIVAPFVIPGDRALLPLVGALAVTIVALPLVWRRPIAIPCLALGVATFAAGARFGGSYAWLHVGFQTDRYPSMAIGRVANLPAILDATWQWHVDSPVTIRGMKTDCRTLLRVATYAGLVTLAIAAGRASRRGGANVLVVLPAAWALVYALMPQMHERYLTWAAATSALVATRSVGGLLLCVALNAISTAMVLLAMIGPANLANDPAWHPLFRALEGLQPNVGYAVITLTATLFVWAVSWVSDPPFLARPSRRRGGLETQSTGTANTSRAAP